MARHSLAVVCSGPKMTSNTHVSGASAAKAEEIPSGTAPENVETKAKLPLHTKAANGSAPSPKSPTGHALTGKQEHCM